MGPRTHEMTADAGREGYWAGLVDEAAKELAGSKSPEEVLSATVAGLNKAIRCEWAVFLVGSGGLFQLVTSYSDSSDASLEMASGGEIDLNSFRGSGAAEVQVLGRKPSASAVKLLRPFVGTPTGKPSVAQIPVKVELGREGVLLVGVGDSRLPSSESKFLRRVAAMSNALLERKLDSALRQLGEIEKIRALGLLAAGVAHDFNNLLTVILSSGQRLAADSNRGTAELGEFICEAASAAAGTVRRIRQYTGTNEASPRGYVNVLRLMQRCREMTRPHWSTSGDSSAESRIVEIDCSPDIWLFASEAALMDVLTNLVINAAQATDSGGRISMRAFSVGGQVRIELEDDGVGISDADADAEHIFEPFFSTKGTAGQGIGLSAAQQLIIAQNGSIRLEPDYTEGTRFTITLPAATPVESADITTELAPTRNGIVLVVDDEPLVGRLLRDAISSLGHSADYAQTVDAAFVALNRRTYDIVLTDFGMPEMDGVEFAHAIHARGLRPIIVLLTGWVDQERALTAEDGIAEVLTKPVTSGVLGRMIAANLS